MERIGTDLIDMERIMNGIEGINATKIIYNDYNEIEEIHIIADQNRGAKQISRDIQSLLIAKFDIKVDHKKISVAQISSEEKGEKSHRFSIGAIGYCQVDNLVEIKVILKKDGKEFESTVKGANSRNNIYRLFVQATIECVHNSLGINDIFIVEDIVKVIVAKQEVVNIAISFISRDREELLVGCAILKKDDYEAIAKATLDAVNRKVVQLAM
ncbi:MAG: hypothetical protein CVU84_07290 [Firmicutes bacterium HGW-Firmicutes-1]|nr:MAG: hypothetical protein CVU84_07290 [Firmicutes bacterium HGW-Firmicutes-1]